jgi:hypothetical protein
MGSQTSCTRNCADDHVVAKVAQQQTRADRLVAKQNRLAQLMEKAEKDVDRKKRYEIHCRNSETATKLSRDTHAKRLRGRITIGEIVRRPISSDSPRAA